MLLFRTLLLFGQSCIIYGGQDDGQVGHPGGQDDGHPGGQDGPHFEVDGQVDDEPYDQDGIYFQGQGRTNINELFSGLYTLGLHMRSPGQEPAPERNFRENYIPYNFPQDCYGYPCSEYMKTHGSNTEEDLTAAEQDQRQEQLAVQLFGLGGNNLASMWQDLTDFTNTFLIKSVIFLICLLLLAPLAAYILKPVSDNRDYFTDQISESIARATIVVNLENKNGTSENENMMEDKKEPRFLAYQDIKTLTF